MSGATQKALPPEERMSLYFHPLWVRVRAQRGFLSFLLGRHSNGIGVISPDADCSDTESKPTFITKTTIKRGPHSRAPFYCLPVPILIVFHFPAKIAALGAIFFFIFQKTNEITAEEQEKIDQRSDNRRSGGPISKNQLNAKENPVHISQILHFDRKEEEQ